MNIAERFDDSPRAYGDHREAGLDMPRIMPERGTEPSIWLYMPAEQYHEDPAIGSTSHRALRVHPCEFFNSWRGNPEREEEDPTPAQVFGSAVHKVVLEGRAALEREFGCEPDGEWPELLRTMDDMKRLLKPAGYSVSGVKEELIARTKNAFPRAIIYDEIMDEHKRYGRTVLKVPAWHRVLKSAAHISMHPQLSRAFQGGRSEISIFWINRHGVRCKARLDYLRGVPVNGGKLLASISDLKSFSNPRDIPVERAIDNAATSNMQQCAHYIDALRTMIAMLRKGGPGLVADAKGAADIEWLDMIKRCTRMQWHFVFYKSTGAAFADATVHEPQDELVQLVRNQLDLNFQAFRTYYSKYGTSLWVNLGQPRRLANADEVKPWLL